ncbi:MAG TPA: discoidin domain-containing protein [Thermoanaerobaculia bacterium]|nr:discoidin domain-containing protein [Thermoanaerobaculia bacterium]
MASLRSRKHLLLGLALGLLLAAAATSPSPPVVLDDFEQPTSGEAGWEAAPSTGVHLALVAGEGYHGRGMCMEVDFRGGAGYAIARKKLALHLPANYQFSFRLRGDVPANNLEFKLVDPSGENVWWVNRRGFEFPHAWQLLRIKKRHLEFAWGPAGGGEAKDVGSLEIVVTAGTGGKGTVCVDDLTFAELPVQVDERPPQVLATSALPGRGPGQALGTGVGWHSDPAAGETQALTLDFRQPRELGGLTLDWDGADFARRYRVETSDDGAEWTVAHTVADGAPGAAGRSDLYLPEAEARFFRLSFAASAGHGYGLRRITLRPPAFAASPNAFFTAVAKDAPRGAYPRYLTGEQSYWTVVGVDGGVDNALLSEDGTIETGRGDVSIEPFLYTNGALVRWSDVQAVPLLEAGALPIPTVTWERPDLRLAVTAVAGGPAERPVLYTRYRLENHGRGPLSARLFLALRPFQVNPPWQFLSTQGGFAPLRELAWDGERVTINGKRSIVPLTRPAAFGAATFDQGGLLGALGRGEVPKETRIADDLGFGQGALAYDLALAPGAAQAVYLAFPLGSGVGGTHLPDPSEATSAQSTFEAAFARAVQDWTAAVGRVKLDLPPAAAPLARTLQSSLAYILVERQGPALRPGTRSYARAWIRDGALMSAALLRLGHPAPVREFLTWYAGYLFPDGKVPCCVDFRGADPVPENDSHGEFLYLVAEDFRFEHDAALLARLWPKVEAAVGAILTLRAERRTAEYQTPERRVFYGLLPQSISHEGYSAKPMHSYWDDFFALKGLKDAAFLAEALGKTDLAQRWGAARDEFRADLLASLARTMADHRIDYLPGCAELGDFDATSTTIALSPGGELANLPRAAVERTFERYYAEFEQRRDGTAPWEAYTPYELRAVGTFVRLGWRGQTEELLDFFLAGRRPAAWNQWPEVVWHDPRAPKFLGDLPHAWVGSDFLRSFLDLFAYERESDQALVVGAGLPPAWIASPEGVGIRGLRTPYGPLSYHLQAVREKVTLRLEGGLTPPPGGLAISWPLAGTPRSVTLNGKPLPLSPGGEVIVRELPSVVVLRR